MRNSSGEGAWDDARTVSLFVQSGLSFYVVEDGPRPVWLGDMTRHEAHGEHRWSYGGLVHGHRGDVPEVEVLSCTPGALDASKAMALLVGRRAVDADTRSPAACTVSVGGRTVVLHGTTGAVGTAVGGPVPGGQDVWVAARGWDPEGAHLREVDDLGAASRARTQELTRFRDGRGGTASGSTP